MELEISHYRPSTSLIFILLGTLVSIWIVRIYRYRASYHSVHGSLKAPPFSMWLGSMPATGDIYKNSPMNTHPMCTMTLLSRKHNLDGIYYLDTWPISDMRQLCVTDPEVAAQAVQKFNLPKYHIYPQMISHITGKTSMLLLHGSAWKRTRAPFNPGFSAAHLTTLIPMIVDDCLIFHSTLSSLAGTGELTQIEDPLTRLTIDIMGHVIMDHDLNSQISENELVNSFRAAVEHTPNAMLVNPILNWDPNRMFWHWYCSRKMNNYLKKVLQDRMKLRAEGTVELKRKPAIDLAIDEYGGEKVDEEFMQVAIDQMKTFLFAGHDTSKHDEVFGDIGSTAEKLKTDSKLLNELPYTTAVIKETLRLYTPASTARQGSPGLTLTYNGTTHPTANTMVWINNHTMHRSASLFPLSDSFLPARFLPPSHPSFHLSPQSSIPKDAYRAFEKGPRACIGQELAMLEMKIIMALTIREFDITACYEEWDRKLGREKPGEMLDGKRGMFGHRAFQEMKATAKPVDGMPVRVSLAGSHKV
ncbi:cytochrome P450 [Mollisia scopiformis]|uniref:Cytochrome P450 n=1 Tax=Mollisia scopiformis TaxID=149040 RepID=A0A132B304_MOLSC|nr:cytochrome P450 [Mollisia scopiformis]KUJ06776.1 cytochrome P450 [Mollisia scopiformis]